MIIWLINLDFAATGRPDIAGDIIALELFLDQQRSIDMLINQQTAVDLFIEQGQNLDENIKQSFIFDLDLL